MLSIFPLDVLDEIWDLIESVYEGFLIYSFTYFQFFYYKARQRAKWAAMQVATMLADHKQIDKRATFEGPKQKRRLGMASNEITEGGGGASTSLRSTNPPP